MYEVYFLESIWSCVKGVKSWVESVVSVRLKDVAEEDVAVDILMQDGSTDVVVTLRGRWTKYIIYLIRSRKYFGIFGIIDIKIL